jgi:hypothetical protein
MSVLMGVAPKNTSMGKFANALQDLGKASNTAEYQAAIKNMNAMIGDAKGVGGTLQAIYGAFKSAPLQFVAEYVGVEGIQEIAPLLIGGVVSSGAKGAALALKYGQAVAARMGSAAGMTAGIMTDIAESAGGAASGAYDETYKVAIKAGKSPAEADKIAMEIAQRQAFIAAGTTAVSMGIGGAALEKALLGRAGTGLGEALQSLGDFAKTGSKIAIKEGFSEAGEEGVTQGALEAQLYKLDPTRDSAKEITQAAAFGFIAGGPNSMRGWSIRKLGIGSNIFYDTVASGTFNDKYADVQLEANAEYRFNLFQFYGFWMRGAVFTDVGNIWFRNDLDGTLKNAGFTLNRLGKDIAVASGFGTRLDFNYFVLRFDLGFPIKDPRYSPLNSGNDNIKRFYTPKSGGWFVDQVWNKPTFQFAIGYPF